jgi:hypothetical protein
MNPVTLNLLDFDRHDSGARTAQADPFTVAQARIDLEANRQRRNAQDKAQQMAANEREIAALAGIA